MYEMENTTPFATSFCVFFRQTVEQKCVVIEYYTYPGPTSATSILEEYITKGLARDSGELVEQNSLPAVRGSFPTLVLPGAR